MKEFIELMAKIELKLISLTEIIIYLKVKIMINLIWENNQAKQRIIKYKIAKYNNHESNHLSIEIILNL